MEARARTIRGLAGVPWRAVSERSLGPPDPSTALAELRAARRRKRVADIHWIDALYQVYMSAVVGIVVVLVISGIIGGDRLGPARTAMVLRDGPDVLGVAVAIAVGVGLRSGSRGGPVAVEPADARHVLLAPVDRGLALRQPALRQLRFAAFAAVVVGAIAGQLAVRRLGDNPVVWMACGALFCLTTAGLAYGAALLAGGRRLHRWVATLVGVLLVAWAVADAADVIHASPTGVVGVIAFWELDFDPLGLIPIAVAIAAVLAGVAGLGGLSLESAERRTRLVGQLKFAATLQDLRTVMVLRRQLAMELPRSRPWIRQRSAGRLPVWHRGMRGVLRWPAARIVRLLGLAAVTGVCLRAVADGSVALVVVAGLAMYIAALDAVEPMAQEADHPGRSDGLPRPIGDLLVRHLGVGALVMTGVALVAAAVGVLIDPTEGAVTLAAIAVAPAALGAAAGAALSVLQGIQEPSATWELIPPEVQGTRTAFRIAGPPLVAVIGCLPVALARLALDNDGDPYGAATTGAGITLVVVALVLGWIHQRDNIKAWWRSQQELATTARGVRAATAAAGSDDRRPTPTRTRKPTPKKVSTSLPRKR
jgi:hypothetical protein